MSGAVTTVWQRGPFTVIHHCGSLRHLEAHLTLGGLSWNVSLGRDSGRGPWLLAVQMFVGHR